MIKMKSVVLGFSLAALLIAAAVLPAQRASTQSGGSPGQGLEISPALIDQQVDPGQKVTLSIRLRNITEGELIAKGQINDFTAQGEEGQPNVLLDENAEPTSYSMKAWVKSVPDLSLVPDEIKTMQIEVDVPEDAAPGGHYGVIRFTAVPPELKDTGVSLSASIGTLVLLNVSGEVKKQAGFEEFFASNKGGKGSIFEKGPIDLVERIRNSGNVHVKPKGEVIVKNVFGQEVAKLVVNENGGNVLPDSVRKFEQEFSKDVMFGRYSATAEINIGEGEVISQTISFWVVPYTLVGIILFAIILLVIVIRTILGSYKRRIINKAQSGRV